MTRIFYSTWVKPACGVSKISSDGGCQSKETGVGMEVRLLSVGASRRFATLLRRFAAQCSVAPNEKKNLWHPGYYFCQFKSRIIWCSSKARAMPRLVSFRDFIQIFRSAFRPFHEDITSNRFPPPPATVGGGGG